MKLKYISNSLNILSLILILFFSAHFFAQFAQIIKLSNALHNKSHAKPKQIQQGKAYGNQQGHISQKRTLSQQQCSKYRQQFKICSEKARQCIERISRVKYDKKDFNEKLARCQQTNDKNAIENEILKKQMEILYQRVGAIKSRQQQVQL